MRRLPLLLVLAACGSTMGERWDQVQGSDWILLKLEETPVLPGTQISLTLSTGRLYGQAVNRYSAQYEHAEEALTIDAVAAGKKYLDKPPGAMEQEKRYVELLGSADGWEFAGGWLILKREGKVLLTFRRRESEARG